MESTDKITKMSKNIEVEVRSFISEKQYKELLDFFRKEGKFLSEDNQTTHYFDCNADVRIQKNESQSSESYSKIWMKEGKLHDDHREELEIKFDKEDFEKLEKVFLSLGFNVEIKWFRKRYTFIWDTVHVMVDFTKGYGYILELEKMSDESNKEETLKLLKQKLAWLSIKPSSKEEFKKKYSYYKENWKELTK